MDRGTKLMFGALTVAISLMVINMFSNNASQAYAAAGMEFVDRGPEEPTIVWYGMNKTNASSPTDSILITFARAWSDGTIEMRKWDYYNCGSVDPCGSADWQVVSDPNEGLAALSDINGDESVDVLDLLTVIDRWGPAPPNVIPPSDCPLAMINP